jgi:hypothetical protein
MSAKADEEDTLRIGKLAEISSELDGRSSQRQSLGKDERIGMMR